ncbi:MAG TPA: glucokinase [Nitrospiria bacterium]|jgi:glucokinase
MILAGDIGGTKTILSLYRNHSGSLEQVNEEVFKSQEFSQFEKVLNLFLEKYKNEKIGAICIGVAGPVKNGRCETTNLPWVLDEKEISKAWGIPKVKLLNDLEAAAYGMLFLPSHEMAELNKGTPSSGKGNIAVIAAGTGLGEAFLCWNGSDYIPIASEGGHTDFAPQSDQEIELLKFLRSELGHVSYERILSGPGIFNIYRFLRAIGSYQEPDWLKERLQSGDPSATITQIGLAGENDLCVETLNLFASIYGAEAGNLALKALSISGVFIGGGIAPKIFEKLEDGTFMKAFLDKGRYSKLLKQIPVKVSLNSRAPLIGAAYYTARL